MMLPLETETRARDDSRRTPERGRRGRLLPGMKFTLERHSQGWSTGPNLDRQRYPNSHWHVRRGRYSSVEVRAMTDVRHNLFVSGPEARPDGVSGSVLQELLLVAVDGAQRALRLRVEGRSTAPGAIPRWVAAGATFDVVQGRNAQEWRLLGRPLKEAAPEKFGQPELFEDLDVQKSALDLFEEGLQDAVAGREDSDRFDDGLVQVFYRLANIFTHGIDSVRFVNGQDLPIGPTDVQHIENLRSRTPAPQAVRLAGKIESIRHSDRMFLIELESGEKLRGIADAVDEAEPQAVWGKVAVVVGKAVFRPSGRALRIDAEKIGLAGRRDSEMYGRLPQPILRPLDPRSLRESQGAKSGINALWGKWPGDESESDVQEALRRLS